MLGGRRQSPPPKSEEPQGLQLERAAPTFAELLQRTTPAQLAEIKALPPKRRVVLFAEWFQNYEPEQVASAILLFHEGDARAAEADAWEFRGLIIGGTIEDRARGQGNKDGAKFGDAMVDHLLKGTEDPPVPRATKERPRFM